MGRVATKVKEAVRKVTAPKPKTVAKEEVKDNTCTDCAGTGLKDKFTLCQPCKGSGKV